MKTSQRIVQRTRPHKGYITPVSYEIEEKIKQFKIEKLPIPEGVVQDLCNIMSYEFFEDDPKNGIIDPSSWPKLPGDEKQYHEAIQKFLTEIDFNKYPGTPLERAVMIAAHLSQQGGGSGQGKGKEEKDSNGEEKVQAFAHGGPLRGDPGQVARNMEEVIDKIRHMSEFENQALELNNANEMQKIIELSKPQNKFLTEISLRLQGFKRITVARRRSKIPNHNSRKKRHLPFEHFGQLPKVSKVRYLDPLFDYKLATKQLNFKEGYDVKEEKQILMMLIDDSGSMSTPWKLAWRNAVLLNRCEAVAKGDAELIVYRYETGRYGRTHVKTEEEAMKLYESILKHSPHGGGTNIAGVLEESIKEIHSMHGYKPDIMIVLDGQDYFKTMENHGVTVHAIIIGSEHKELERFCTSTGGLFLFEKEK